MCNATKTPGTPGRLCHHPARRFAVCYKMTHKITVKFTCGGAVSFTLVKKRRSSSRTLDSLRSSVSVAPLQPATLLNGNVPKTSDKSKLRSARTPDSPRVRTGGFRGRSKPGEMNMNRWNKSPPNHLICIRAEILILQDLAGAF